MLPRKSEKVFWFIAALASPGLPLILYFAGNWYSFFHSYSLGMAFGIFSYGYFLNALIVSARIRYFDRLFGHDRVLVFHGYLALAALVLALAHFFTKTYYMPDPTTQTVIGMVGLMIFVVVMVVTVLFMIDTVLHRIRLIARFKRFAVKKLGLDYSRLKLFHNITSVAVLLVTIHVLMASGTQENTHRMLFMSIWGGIALVLFVYHKFLRVLLAHRSALTVSKVTELTPSITEIELQRSKSPAKLPKAGQFSYFRFLSPVSGHAEHPFTISSAPHPESVTITIKNLGDFSERVKKIPVGTKVLADGPYGVFSPCQNGQPHLFVAGGVGITPFLSILKQWSTSGIRQPTALVWSVRIESEMIHREFFEQLAVKEKNFRFVPAATRKPDGSDSGQRINRMLLQSALEGANISKAAVYFCGPESLRGAVFRDLRTLGVPRKHLHYEKFSF